MEKPSLLPEAPPPEPGARSSERIFDQLADDIVSERLQAGSLLRGERMLAEQFGVSRQTIREAVQKLAQADLLSISRGFPSTVRDYTRSAGLSFLHVLVRGAPPERSESALDDAFELRALLRAEAARLCAKQASSVDRDAIVRLSEQLGAEDGLARAHALDTQFWTRVFQAANNVALLWAFNDVQRALHGSPAAVERRFALELRVSDARRRVAEAIARGDADAAEASARNDERAQREAESVEAG